MKKLIMLLPGLSVLNKLKITVGVGVIDRVPRCFKYIRHTVTP